MDTIKSSNDAYIAIITHKEQFIRIRAIDMLIDSIGKPVGSVLLALKGLRRVGRWRNILQLQTFLLSSVYFPTTSMTCCGLFFYFSEEVFKVCCFWDCYLQKILKVTTSSEWRSKQTENDVTLLTFPWGARWRTRCLLSILRRCVNRPTSSVFVSCRIITNTVWVLFEKKRRG